MPAAAAALVYLVPLTVIAVIDVRTMRAPNRYVYPLIALAVVLSLTLFHDDVAEALLGGVLAFAVLLVIAFFGRGRMGFGDVKYGLVCGITVGLHGTLPMLAFAILAGAAVAAVAVGFKLRTRQDVVAFTPFLLLGVVFSLLWSRPYLVL